MNIESDDIFKCSCGKQFELRKYKLDETFHCHKDICFRIKDRK